MNFQAWTILKWRGSFPAKKWLKIGKTPRKINIPEDRKHRDHFMDIPTIILEEKQGNKAVSMEKRFYKTYPKNVRLGISFLEGLPIFDVEKALNNLPNEEMERDKKYFEDRRYSENLLTELKQRGFSEDE